MQNHTNREITFDTQLKPSLLTLTSLIITLNVNIRVILLEPGKMLWSNTLY